MRLTLSFTGSISSASDHGYDTESLTSASMPTDAIFEPPYTSSNVDQVGLEAEDMINTQQDRYSCGQRIANISANCIQTDLDYELFRLDDPRFHTDNAISLPTMQESAQMLRPGKPARMPLDAAVWVFTGTTGSVRGTMTSTAHYIKMEGSRTFQEMWAVHLDRETSKHQSLDNSSSLLRSLLPRARRLWCMGHRCSHWQYLRPYNRW